MAEGGGGKAGRAVKKVCDTSCFDSNIQSLSWPLDPALGQHACAFGMTVGTGKGNERIKGTVPLFVP